MAQRWLQAKEMLAKKNGRVKSGAGNATGAVRDDIVMSRGTAKPDRSTIKPKVRAVVLKADRPKAWTYTGADPYTC